MSGHHLEVLPLSRHGWTVRYEGDPTPLSEHPTLTDARAEAPNSAMRFGEPVIQLHAADRGEARGSAGCPATIVIHRDGLTIFIPLGPMLLLSVLLSLVLYLLRRL